MQGNRLNAHTQELPYLRGEGCHNLRKITSAQEKAWDRAALRLLRFGGLVGAHHTDTTPFWERERRRRGLAIVIQKYQGTVLFGWNQRHKDEHLALPEGGGGGGGG